MTSIHYLDTSALVKLIVYPDLKAQEPGSKELYEFRQSHTGFYTLDLCVGEALNVLKQKSFSRPPRKQLRFPQGYLICIDNLLTLIKPQHMVHVIPPVDINKVETRDEVFDIVKRHRVDFVDALVIVTAKNRRPYSKKQNLLITADDKMQIAAEELGLNVWNCRKQVAPS